MGVPKWQAVDTKQNTQSPARSRQRIRSILRRPTDISSTNLRILYRSMQQRPSTQNNRESRDTNAESLSPSSQTNNESADDEELPRPYHTSLRRHNAVRNLRRMLQTSNTENTSSAWTSFTNFNIENILFPHEDGEDDNGSNSFLGDEAHWFREHLGPINWLIEEASTRNSRSTSNMSAERSRSNVGLSIKSSQASSRFAWLSQKPHSSGLVPGLTSTTPSSSRSVHFTNPIISDTMGDDLSYREEDDEEDDEDLDYIIL